jgi:membrane dipeptidase
MLRTLAKNGGVIGINFGEGFINEKDAAALRASISQLSQMPNLTGKALDDYAAKDFAAEFDAPHHQVFATVEDVVAHIDHAVKIAGIDHVGIGSDFDGIQGPPQGLEDISKMPSLVAALLKHGYSEVDIKKILGGNTLRVIRAVTGS